jgi:hypothetical protein
MARPTKGLQHVDALVGDEQAKERLKWILRTLLGLRTVQEALAALGIGRTYFAMLRTRALESAHGGLSPRPCGRPKRESAASVAELEALRRRVAELEHENAELQARLALAPVLAARRRSRPKRHGDPALAS